MGKISISISDLEYTTRTRGWNDIIIPYWFKQKKLLQTKFETVSRKVNDLSQLKYDRGFLDGYISASNIIESILRGQRLKNRLSQTDVKEGV